MQVAMWIIKAGVLVLFVGFVAQLLIHARLAAAIAGLVVVATVAEAALVWLGAPVILDVFGGIAMFCGIPALLERARVT